jgi:pimeloyl-ACP methyl ester carboxylesterase
MVSKLAIGAAAVLVVIAGALAGMIAFGTSAPPPVMASIGAPFRNVDFSGLPPVETIVTRNGSTLAFRHYLGNPNAGGPDRSVIAIHGSSANSASLHPLAVALRNAGMNVYVPDVRGHGRTGQRGDIDYRNQIDDDLAVLIAEVKKKRPDDKLVLLGFSSGGGYALHAATTPSAAALERTVLISPMLGPFAPTAKAGASAWAKPYIPRIVALLALERIGIHAFDHLTTVAFAVSGNAQADLTAAYSFGLMRAFGTSDYAADLRKASARMAVLVGENDELFDAALFAPTIHAVRPDFSVTIVPELGHIAMTTDARAVPAILAAIRDTQ